MVTPLGPKGKPCRPAYWARSAKNDPPVAFPNLYPTRNQKNGIEAAQAGKKKAQGLDKHEDRTSITRLVPISTRDVHARDTAASSAKRKLDTTRPESLPAAKRIHSTGKEGREKNSEPETADRYKYMKQSQIRDECRSRSLPAGGSNPEIIKRINYDSARAQISPSQDPVKETVSSCKSPRSDPLDNMLQKELREECVKRSLPARLAKGDLRRCIRLYDAARALGLTPEESLEAQRATFEQSIGEYDVSPGGPIEENAFGSISKEVIEGHTQDNSQKFVEGHGSTFLEYPEDDTSRSTISQASSDKDFASSSFTSQGSSQDRNNFDVCPGSVATPDYAAMGMNELRSFCRSRSVKQSGLSTPQLRRALKLYSKKLAEQANNAEVKVDAERKLAELGHTPTAFPQSVAFINLDSSSQDAETPEKRTRSVVTSAAIAREQPASGYLWTVNKGQRAPVSTDAQVKGRRGSMKKASAERPSEKVPYISPYSPPLVLKPAKGIGNESSPRRTPYNKGPMSLQQPLVSLLNLTIKDARIGASTSAHQKTQMKAKPLSELAIKRAEKEDFNTRYATESPSWICCCDTPGYEVRQKQLANFSGNCFYHVSQLAQRGTFTMKDYQEYQITQQALDRIASCLCRKLAVDHPEHQVTMTQGGFILAQIWREQLTRRQSLTTFKPDIAAYRRKGILEVMQNVLEDFMIELSSRQQKRPLVLWARIEAMAWFINTLPTSNEWQYFQEWRRPCRYIMLFGIALLTTIDALLQQNVFRDNESKVPNLGLVLALFIQSTWNSPACTMNSFHSKDAYKSPFNNDICVNNENGWAAEVVSLADQHGVRIHGLKTIDFIVDRWRLRKKSFESTRDQSRREQYAILHNGETVPPSEATMASIVAKEGETPANRGTGQRVTWMPEDDYDDNGKRLWKKWFYLREFEIYTREYQVTT